ncbi:MAG: hypothetical protein AAB425_13805 [Bdellovibrionota bacterium]
MKTQNAKWPTTLLFLFLLIPGTLARAAAPTQLCTPQENWPSPRLISPQNRAWQTFEAMLDGKASPLFLFAQSLALRALSQEPTHRDAAEYLVARALHQTGQLRAAQGAFYALATRADAHPAFFSAALGCLNRISRDHTAVTPSPDWQARLETTFLARAKSVAASLGADPDEILAETAARLLFVRLGGDSSATPSQTLDTEKRLLKLTEQSTYQSLAAGFLAVRAGNDAAAVQNLALVQPGLPGTSPNPKLAPWQEASTIELARALFALKKFDQAVPLLQNFAKHSNLLVDALSDLTWAHLMKYGYSSSIGASLSLRLGGLRRTFTPEASMVLAMSLNELCQYPDAIRAVKLFRKDFGDARSWLAKWSTSPREAAPSGLYPIAAGYLKNTKSAVPLRIASEWTRSPLFLARQDALNLLFRESKGRPILLSDAAIQQKQLALDLVRFSRELRRDYDSARIKLKPGEELPSRIQDGLTALRLKVSDYQKTKAAGPLYARLMKAQDARKPAEQNNLLAAIEKDLTSRSRTLLARLDEIGENTALIEVEIFNGASQDLLWANAHPDYREVLAKAGAQENDVDDEKTGSNGVMDWGRSPASRLAANDSDTEEEGEIWEDELGSFKAQLFDNCSNRDRYLAIRMKTADAANTRRH